jgi:hypothetical protein
MIHASKLVFGLGLALAAMGADASPTQTHLGIGYVGVNIDGIDESIDGFGVRGLIVVAPRWHLYARFDQLKLNRGSFDADFDQTSMGIGFHHALNASTDFHARVSVERVSASVSGFSVDGNGAGLYSGIRTQPAEAWTFGAGLEYTYIEDDGSLVGRADAQYQFTNSFAMAVDVEFDEDGQTWFVGPRLTF